MIPSDHPHQLRLDGTDSVLMIWLDPEFKTHRSLSHIDDIRYPLKELEKQLVSLCHQPLTCENAREIRNLITGQASDSGQRVLDDRITDAVDWISRHLHEQTITTEQLAGEVYLSPSRFMHLFSGQIGIPVRKYILWQRLRHALLLLAGGHSITEAAHGAGFTDSSHMNRTFNAMFGINPSLIFKNSRFIQVFGC